MQFSNYRLDIELGKKHSRKINTEDQYKFIDEIKDNPSQFKAHVESFGISTIDLTDKNIAQIIEKATKVIDPYLE